MPLTLLGKLEEQREEVLKFREALKDSPIHLERAEAAFKSFERVREELRKEAPRFHEEKGILAGMNLSGPIIRQHQEITKSAIRDEILDAAVGKEMVRVLARAADSLVEAVEKRTEEIQRRAGKLDGMHWAAQDSLKQIEEVLRHYAAGKRHEEDDDDWDGRRAAANAGGNGKGGEVVKLSAAKKKKNGAKKKTPRKKAARKPRKVKTEAAPPTEN